MKTALFAALVGLAAPAALLAQTATPPTDPSATGTMPADAPAASGAAASGAATDAAGTATTPGAAATAASNAAGGAADPAAPDSTPQELVNQLASGGMFEVRSSELALERSSDPEVQEFAQRMINDHGAINDELKALADSKGLTVPTEISGPPAEHMQAVSDAEAAGFDEVYLDHQAQAHQETLDLLAPWTTATAEVDTDLAAFAQKTLQAVTTHAEHLETMRN